MYLDIDAITKIASLITAIGVISAAFFAVYKVEDDRKRQAEINKAQQEELTIICYGLKGALQGLIEQGCNGPCKEALNMLEKHLNKEAHK